MEKYLYRCRDGTEIEIERYSRERIEELKERVKTGNDKLMAAWAQIIQIEGSKHDEEIKKWMIAQNRLMVYCDQLQMLGFNNCLYLDGKGNKTRKCIDVLGCVVCPSNIHYWSTELSTSLWDDMKSASKGKK